MRPEYAAQLRATKFGSSGDDLSTHEQGSSTWIHPAAPMTFELAPRRTGSKGVAPRSIRKQRRRRIVASWESSNQNRPSRHGGIRAGWEGRVGRRSSQSTTSLRVHCFPCVSARALDRLPEGSRPGWSVATCSWSGRISPVFSEAGLGEFGVSRAHHESTSRMRSCSAREDPMIRES